MRRCLQPWTAGLGHRAPGNQSSPESGEAVKDIASLTHAFIDEHAVFTPRDRYRGGRGPPKMRARPPLRVAAAGNLRSRWVQHL